MRSALTCSLALLMIAAVPASAQTVANRQVLALDQVVAARQELLNDTTRFARCPVLAVLGAAASQVSQTRRLSAAVEHGTVGCSEEDRLPRPYQTRLVILDSISTSGASATVHLTVQRGDLVFRERHELQWLDAVTCWMVARVIVGDAEHHSYARRPPPTADPCS